ncbi:putative TPX2 central domain-containing protein [Helianthus annuus]|nr:putative TPX2 central domain-containing protein [Helianthus annuus]KAJ0653504.1 putative TPX2 central domain-containing protein [Helianthus annuus]KAJ0845980.1 putative TPX2 central domain-containing protein [Helianthus annuus]
MTEDYVEGDAASYSESDIDSEYEFDAPQFYDFSKDETESEAEDAENWFRSAHEYPPSPFLVKYKLMKAAKKIRMKPHNTTSTNKEANKKTSTSSNSDCDIDHKAATREVKDKVKGVKHHSHIPQNKMKAKSKSAVNLPKLSGSSFMKPTASHLAKQNKESSDIHSGGGCGRLQKPFVSAGEKLRSPIRCQNQTTKRQKLEFGYLRKAAQLKHRPTFSHKVAKKAAKLEGSSNFSVKTTIPKTPALVTQERAQKLQDKYNSVLQPKAIHAVRARPLNRKVGDCNLLRQTLDALKLPHRTKSMSQSNEFQTKLWKYWKERQMQTIK